MIDTKELRRLAQAANAAPDGDVMTWMEGMQRLQGALLPGDVLELLDRLEEAEKERDNANAAAIGVALQADALQAEIDNIKEVQFDLKVSAVAEGWRGKCERLEKERDAAELMSLALRAKITEMEQQEPVATVRINDINGNPSVDFIPGHHYLHHNSSLYALPGAQKVPSVPVVTPKMEQAFYEKVEVTSVGSIRGLADGIKAAILSAAPEAKP